MSLKKTKMNHHKMNARYITAIPAYQTKLSENERYTLLQLKCA